MKSAIAPLIFTLLPSTFAAPEFSAAAIDMPARSGGEAPRATDATPQLIASDAETARFFETFIERKMEALEIPGGALVVVRDGRALLVRGFGVTDLASGRAVDPQRTLFRAASISKLLPWLLVMQLVEDGRIDLDADAAGYLGFRVSSDPSIVITMRQLMTHTAGFPERFHGVFDADVTTPLGEKLRQHRAEPVFVPGSTVAYANYGAALAGHVVERLHDQSWSEVVQKRVFAPLDMRQSTVAQPVPLALAADLASTYTHYDNRPAPFRTTAMAPLGSLSASAADMQRLLAMLVDGARGIDGPIVSATTVQRMMKLDRPLGPGLPDGMGLGFLVGEYHGVRYAGHAGNMSTVATDLEVLPDLGLGWYYVLTSQGPAEDARGIRQELLHAAIDALVAPAPAAPTSTSRVLSTAEEVAGAYISTRRLHAGPLMFSGLMNTTLVAARPDGGLTIRMAGAESLWQPTAPDRFVHETSGIPLAVTRDTDGQVRRIASAALYPAAEFERPPPFARLVAPIAAFSFTVVLGAMVVRSCAGALAWWQRRKGVRGQMTTQRGGVLPAAARMAFAGTCAALLGWGGVGILLAVDFANLFTFPWLVRMMVGALSLLVIPFAMILLADALVGGGSKSVGHARRLGSLLLAVAACGLAWLVVVLELWNFTTNW